MNNITEFPSQTALNNHREAIYDTLTSKLSTFNTCLSESSTHKQPYPFLNIISHILGPSLYPKQYPYSHYEQSQMERSLKKSIS